MTTELLKWHTPESDMPDSDTTVLLWLQDGPWAEWDTGYWDGDDWRLAEGRVCAGTVVAWAEPEGPKR